MNSNRPWTKISSKWGDKLHSMSSYLGTFPPSLARSLIEMLSDEGDIVLDPFSGRGTTLLECRHSNRFGIASDLNPLAYRLTKAKNSIVYIDELIERVDQLEQNFDLNLYLPDANVQSEDIKLIYHPYTLAQLCYLKEELLNAESDLDNFIFGILIGAMHGGERKDGTSMYASISMPNTFSMSPEYVRKFVGKNNIQRKNRNVFSIIKERINKQLGRDLELKKGIVVQEDVKRLSLNNTLQPYLRKVDLILTSPPYLNVINYALQNWIKLWLLSEDPQVVHKKLDDNLPAGEAIKFLMNTIRELKKFLKPDGILVLVVGDVVKSETSRISPAREILKRLYSENLFSFIGLWNDEISEQNKVTKIWNDTKGKATSIDRIIILSDIEPKFYTNRIDELFNINGKEKTVIDIEKLKSEAVRFSGIQFIS